MTYDSESGRITPSTAFCVLTAIAALAVVLPWPWQVTDPRDPVTSAALMVASGVIWGLICWVLVLLGAAALTRTAGRLGAGARLVLIHVAPHALRALVVTTVGVGAGLALTGPALAGTAPTQGPPAAAAETEGAAVVLDVDWPEPSVDWPDAPLPEEATAPAPVGDGTNEHVVMRGDSLWSIAAQHLPADADAAAISASWQQWFEANRDVIGPDPDRILPGQRLLAPASQPGGTP